MVVQHNMQAINANRMLSISTRNLSATTEKLSSGYRINRAADDAAGLSISEKMRKQIRGLTQASANSEDGISCVQTAEGALTEVHDMLQRMNELCVKAATGTNAQTDRQYIQDEIDQLISEIDRVAETTKFNETYLLKGDKNSGTYKTFIAFIDKTFPTQTLYDSNGNEVSGMALSNYFDENGTYKGGLFTSPQASIMDEVFSSPSAPGYITGVSTSIQDCINLKVTDVNEPLKMEIQAGADSLKNNKIPIIFRSLTSAGLGVDKLSTVNVGIVDEYGLLATDAINVVADAIQKVSAQRSFLGAIQNRLEHTIKNLDNVVENTTASESQIRDTDMAKQMVSYSNLSILTQAGQSMLAQTNQANQGILSILG